MREWRWDGLIKKGLNIWDYEKGENKSGRKEGMNGGLFLSPSGMTPVGGEDGGGGVDRIMRCLAVEFGWAIGRSIGGILGAFIPV
jgi:hypothetical protein